jgi:cytochrome c
MDESGRHGIGPNLRGIIGSPIARSRGFAFSGALTSQSGAWTEEKLDAFLRDPQAFAPGTRMDMAGLTRASDRAAVIAYLRSVR